MVATTLKNQAMNAETRLASKVITATRDMTAATGNVAYTGVGFTPTSIIAFATIDGTVYPISWGFSDSALTEKSLARNNDTFWYGSLNALVYAVQAAGANQTCVVASYDTDGFTLTWTKANSPTGTLNIIFLCFR